MSKKELFKHTQYVDQLQSASTKMWSFKVFIPYEEDLVKKTYTKTFSEKKYQSARLAYQAAIADRDAVLTQIRTIGLPEKTNITSLEMLHKFFDMSALSAESKRKKRLTFCKWTSTNIQNTKIDELKASHIQQSLADAAKMKGISQGILDDLYCIWGQIFKTALKMDAIFRNPMDKVDKVKIKKKKEKKRIAETDLKTLLTVCDSIITHTQNIPWQKYNSQLIVYALKVSWFTAMRPGEVLALEYQHVDFKRKLVYVRQEVGMTADREGYVRDTKTEMSHRNIPLNAEALELFAEIMEFQKDEKYLFADFHGKLMNSTYIAGKIKRACSYCGADFNWYCLRHQYSTDMQRNREDMSITAKGMGHENINMTYQYTRLNDNDLRAAMDRLGRSLKA